MGYLKVLFSLGFSLMVLTAFAQPTNLPLPDCHSVNEPGIGECELLYCRLCNLNGYMGSTAGFGGDLDGDLPLNFCGDSVGCVQNIAFYVAVQDLDITVTASNCTMNSGGIDLGVNRYCDDFPLTGCIAGDGTNSTTLSLNSINPGLYVLIIDVDASGACDLDITVDPPDGTIPVNPPVEDILGDLEICPNSDNIYHVEPFYPGTYYQWTFPPDAGVANYNLGEYVLVHWGETGGEICVKATHPCYPPSDPVCKTVIMTPIPPTVFPPVTICNEDAPFELPWGGMVSTSGTYSKTIQSFKTCDSTLVQSVTILPAIKVYLPPMQLCEGSCLTICGQNYCEYNNYSVTCQSYLGCDSVISFSVIPPVFTADILGGGTLSCANPVVTLNSANSPGVKTWTNSNGEVLGMGNLLSVTSPGTYILTVTLMVAGETCVKTSSIVITGNNNLPNVIATGTTLGCDSMLMFVHVDSLPGAAIYTWSGPNGFVSNLQNPPVTEIGMYIVTVENPVNGCSANDTVFVKTCCVSAGTLDTTLLTVCGEKNLFFNFHGDQILNAGDSLIFFLYSNPADPFGSILMYSDTPLFPFIAGLQQLDSVYFVAAFVGPMLPDTSGSFQNSCWAISPAQPVRWVHKPGIMVVPAPFVACKGDCIDITFQFTGAPPFQFHFNITQNGVLVFSKDETSDALQKTVTICPDTFTQMAGSSSLNFKVNFFQDARCNCND